jgi:hypothetical protein
MGASGVLCSACFRRRFAMARQAAGGDAAARHPYLQMCKIFAVGGDDSFCDLFKEKFLKKRRSFK